MYSFPAMRSSPDKSKGRLFQNGLSFGHDGDEDNVDVYIKIFLAIVKSYQSLIINTKRSILEFASVLDPPLNTIERL